MASTSDTTGLPSPFPNSPQIMTAAHKNKLTQCFDDILKVASEMLVQQQLKTVQLDSAVINGFSQTQQKLLGEKIHTFHSILDDLETTLHKSKTYVQSVYDIGVEKEKKREEEREELRRKKEQEEQARKEEEEKRRQQELQKRAKDEEEELNRNQQPLGNKSSEPKLDFGLDPSNSLLADFDTNSGDIDMSGVLGSKDLPVNLSKEENSNIQASQQLRQYSTHQSPKPNQKAQQNNSNDLGMNMSILSGLDNDGLDMSDFNTNVENSKDKVNNDNVGMPLIDNFQRALDNNDVTPMNGAPTGNIGENEDDYLTLNDFNDFNIDWNTTGNPGDLDLNDFNI